MDTYSRVMTRLMGTNDAYLIDYVHRVTAHINHHLATGDIDARFTDALARCIDTATSAYLEKKENAAMALRVYLAYLNARTKGGLTLRNFHEHDFRIVFFEEGHRYVLLTPNPEHGTYEVKRNTKAKDGTHRISCQ